MYPLLLRRLEASFASFLKHWLLSPVDCSHLRFHITCCTTPFGKHSMLNKKGLIAPTVGKSYLYLKELPDVAVGLLLGNRRDASGPF